MSISGNLKTMEFSDLLQWLSQGQKTGTLVIDNGSVEKRIFFRAGRIVSSSSSDPNEYLGHFLVSHGFISEEELAHAMAMQEKSGTLLGKILETIGVISSPDLQRMLQMKAEESIYQIFTWREGEFEFLDGRMPDRPMVSLNLDVTGLVLEGMQRLDEWRRIRGRIPSDQCIPVAVSEVAGPADDPGAQRILDEVNDDRTIEEIALRSHASEFHVCRVLFDQIEAGRVKVVRPRGVGPVPPPVPAGRAVTGEALMKEAAKMAGRRELASALRHLQAARSLEPDNKPLQGAVQKLEAAIREEVEKDGVVLAAVPQLARPFEELTSLPLSPQEGFILSRINGSYDLGSILKISPMPPLEAQVVVWKLLQAGHIRVGKS